MSVHLCRRSLRMVQKTIQCGSAGTVRFQSCLRPAAPKILLFCFSRSIHIPCGDVLEFWVLKWVFATRRSEIIVCFTFPPYFRTVSTIFISSNLLLLSYVITASCNFYTNFLRWTLLARRHSLESLWPSWSDSHRLASTLYSTWSLFWECLFMLTIGDHRNTGSSVLDALLWNVVSALVGTTTKACLLSTVILAHS